jgi:hypothetical protein
MEVVLVVSVLNRVCAAGDAWPAFSDIAGSGWFSLSEPEP